MLGRVEEPDVDRSAWPFSPSLENEYQKRKSMVKLAALGRIIAPKLCRADISVLSGTLKPMVELCRAQLVVRKHSVIAGISTGFYRTEAQA